MTVDEIKKALRECRSPGKCDDCPLKDNNDCMTLLKWDALNAIEELEERIGIVQESMETLEKRCNALEALEQRCKTLEVLEKRNEPIRPDMILTTSAGSPMSYCPNCNEPINQYRHPKFCGACGQAVEWE